MKSKSTEILSLGDFGLPRQTKISQTGEKSFVLDKQRASRLIMQDGHKIYSVASLIWKYIPNAQIDVLISGPICSKTKKFLKELKINIIQN